ncbi:glucoamylase family protein [Chitinophaga rhizophila]|uniref:Cellobiose phosphorylase n=1 Tax=Chitinophaga rhizophila TaxID=2866212 RepID=A0ABS7GKC3_9BACT|nr:glucoamylase family protein [Chitinophaga rhizophila]MBW8687209.1 hypothetical protein [Chitinophaga rhizophila]
MINKLFRLRKPSHDERYQYLKKMVADEPPFRSVLVDQAEIAAHCKVMAERDKLVSGNHTTDWNRNLADIARNFDLINTLFADTSATPREVVTMREWTTTDYNLVQGYINKLKGLFVKVDPALPFIRKGINGRQPRLYSFLVKIVSHTDTQITFHNLAAFFKAYQRVAVMTATELKAIPALITYVLIENIQRLAARFALAAIDTANAGDWAQRVIAAADDERRLEMLTQEMLAAGLLSRGAFTAELIGQLLKQQGDMERPLALINQRLYELCYVGEDYVYEIQEILAADKISLRSAISALRMLDAIDWQNFIDEISVVEAVYITEPSGIYAAMDYSTRDSYRMATHAIAKKAAIPEAEVARRAMELAAATNNHVGALLLGEERAELEASLAIPADGWISKLSKNMSLRLTVYLVAIAALAALIAGLLFFTGHQQDIPTALLLLISTSYISSMVIDQLIILKSEPKLLPRMNYLEDIPAESRTLVVVPSLLTSTTEIEELVTALEIRFLGNRYEHLHFALLTDFKDAPHEISPEDEVLLSMVDAKIVALNHKYNDPNRFFLLHRHRRWNPNEQCWMGHERKRGKLNDLNLLLRNGGELNFLKITGNKNILSTVKYVITLDADTQLLPETAWKLVGTMAHPLNRPVYCEERKRVVAGYGILQPAVKLDIREIKDSLYHQLAGSGPEVDPYLRTFPDVYQDLFAEGSFVGKGIYDVDIFLKTIDGQLPENRILSHDLLEGSYIRSGLLNDVKLNEGAFTYWVDLKRKHRWIRGDWQIAAWIGRRVPGPAGKRVRNPLSALSRWKIFDNLRLCMYSVVLLSLFLMGWTVYVPLLAVFPTMILLLTRVGEISKYLFRKRELQVLLQGIGSRFVMDVYRFACLPHEAWLTLDATFRALWRMGVSRKKLLEWVPSGAQHITYTSLPDVYRLMWVAPAVGMVSLIYLHPLGLLWILAPFMAWKLNFPSTRKEAAISDTQHKFLQSLTRKTWAYFEQFANEEHHWLPPDHYQEQPVGKVAAYTSPTNLGLGLLANLAAHDFGYLTSGRFITFTSHTLHSIGRLERYKGHFYNWYNTHSMQPSYPRYVSSVDSGNFAGHLMVMRQGLKAMIDQPVFSPALFNGLLDTLRLCEQPALLVQYADKLSIAAKSHNFRWQESRVLLEALAADVHTALAAGNVPPESDSAYWLAALQRQVGDIMTDLTTLAPWSFSATATAHIPAAGVTLRQLANLPMEPAMQSVITAAQERMQSLESMYAQCTDYADMEYDFLYDKEQHLLSIGYRVEEGSLDVDCYDVLASEARLATYVAVCQGKLPVQSWFALRRPLVNIEGEFILQSANGTMFEYLMPLLVMPEYDDTLLHLASASAVTQQISYGQRHNVPWGISESCYSTTDLNMNYQYKVNGVPALSLKNGRMTEEIVMSSYSAAMALMVAPELAVSNLERMAADGFDGRYGLIESVDYMPSRMPHGQTSVPVRTFMAHHQGMSFLALHYLLMNKRMHQHFEADPELMSAVMLLQEKIPWDAACYIDQQETSTDVQHTNVAPAKEMGSMNVTADYRKAWVQLLSNGRYHLMATGSGSSFSRWNDIAVTRWRDTRNTNGGLFFRVRDLDNDSIWSSICHEQSDYNVTFLHGQVRWVHSNNELELISTLAVSPEDDLEVRQVTIRNHSDLPRYVEVTGYADLLLYPMSEQRVLHTSLQAEVRADRQSILCRRYGPLDTTPVPEAFFMMKLRDTTSAEYTYEADITGDSRQQQNKHLRSGIIATIKSYVTIPPQSAVTADICLGIADTQANCEALLNRVHDAFDPATSFAQAAAHAHTLLQQTNATEKDVLLSTGLLGRLIFADNLLLQGVVHGYPACCVNFPTILLKVRQTADMQAVEQLVELQTYWRVHGFPVNLIIQNEDSSSYRHFLHRLINEFINAGPAAEALNRQYGGILVRMADARMDTLDNYSVALHEIIAEQWIFQANRLKGFSTNKQPMPAPETGALVNL